jgi:hypothetical protein
MLGRVPDEVPFLLADVTRLPFRSDSVDVAVCIRLLNLVDLDTALRRSVSCGACAGGRQRRDTCADVALQIEATLCANGAGTSYVGVPDRMAAPRD